MVRLGDHVSDKVAGSGRLSGIKDDVISITGIDGDAGGKLLSADALMRVFPYDSRGRFKVVYKRRPSDRHCANPAKAYIRVSTLDGEEDDNVWIVDPHPLECYGEALHTPTEVLAMFPDV
ncbi:hypothetical protein Hanom_Chr00s000280g01633351 [Helianthus anomalus]